MAVAFNAAPGTVGPDEPGPYGAYATALTEIIGAGGLALDDVFARVRLRVSEVTGDGEVPWYASRFDDCPSLDRALRRLRAAAAERGGARGPA